MHGTTIKKCSDGSIDEENMGERVSVVQRRQKNA
jgi:hypothetical protein